MSRARDIANYGDGIDTSSITSGTFADARIPNLATSKITSGTFADARIASSNVTQHEASIDALASNPTIQLGSNATFPVGHILQVQTYSDQESNTITSSYVNYYEKSITLISGSSDVVVNFGFVYQIAAINGFGIKIYRDTSATVTTSDTLVWNQNTDNGNPYTVYRNTGDNNGTFSGLFQDTLSGFSSGDTLYYGIFLKQYHSGGAVYVPPGGSVSNGFIRMQFMEVQK